MDTGRTSAQVRKHQNRTFRGIEGGAAYSFFWLSDPVGTFWEVTFTLVNIGQITLMTFRNRSTRFNVDEQAFYTQIVPSLEPYQVRRLLRIGLWLDAEPGTQLTYQGEV